MLDSFPSLMDAMRLRQDGFFLQLALEEGNQREMEGGDQARGEEEVVSSEPAADWPLIRSQVHQEEPEWIFIERVRDVRAEPACADEPPEPAILHKPDRFIQRIGGFIRSHFLNHDLSDCLNRDSRDYRITRKR